MSGHDRVSIRFPRLFERDGRSARSRRVFISYRRAGGQAYAVAFLQGLTQVLGEGAVFLDVSRNALELGVPWRDSVRKAIDQSDTLLLVLDPGMASRLADPEDAVRFELEMAIRMGLRVLMVRVDDAVVTAATDLPESLVILPTLHSPAVHSDNAVADIERVIEDLTGRAPGEAKAIDGWDLVVLGTLTVVGVIAWAAKGVQLLNTDQTLLWGSVLLGPWLAWMSARRLIPLGSRSRTRRNFPQAAGWLALGLVLSVAWSMAFARVYDEPTFGDEGGILVARFAGDPSDEHRDDFIEAIREEVQGLVRADADSIVKASPYLINEENARRHGASSGASAVLWGTVTAAEDTSPTVVAELLLIERKSVKQLTKRFRGTVDKRNMKLGGDLLLMQKALPRLLEGYREYYNATDSLGYKRALTYFGKAVEVLDAEENSIMAEIVASLHFYQGNTYLLTGRADFAIAAFQKAVGHSLNLGDENWPTYIEAVNNLGWLLVEQGQVERAIVELRRADQECGRLPQYEACAYVWYNLGIAFLDARQYDNASASLDRAIARLDAVEGLFGGTRDTTAVTLKAYAHQSRAYGLVKLAIAGDPVDYDLLKRAEDERERGLKTLADAGLEVPDWFSITRARIHIARREWVEAIEVISGLELEGEYEWSVLGLLAGAYYCDGRPDRAFEVLEPSLLSMASGAVEARTEASAISETCNATS